MNKLKNNFLDIFFFYTYLLLVLTVSAVLFVSISSDGFDFENVADKLRKRITGQSAKVHSKIINIEKNTNSAIVKAIRGAVFLTHKGVSTQLKLGDVIEQGSLIETKEKSFVTIMYGQDYELKIMIGPKSKVNCTSIMLSTKQRVHENLFGLVHGTVRAQFRNPKKKADLSINTKSVVFGVRGTTFFVATDQDKFTLLIVKEGLVEGQNFIRLSKKMISAGSSYLIWKNGEEREYLLNDIFAKINWDFNTANDFLPEIEDFLKYFDTTGLDNQSITENKTTDNLTTKMDIDIKKELNNFSIETKEIQDSVDSLNDYLTSLNAKKKDRLPGIESDIKCLITSRKECKLFSEKVLIQRGFPRTFGAPRYIQMMVDDLRKQIVEMEEEIGATKKEKELLEALIIKRQEVYEKAMKMITELKDSKEILELISDKSLIRPKE